MVGRPRARKGELKRRLEAIYARVPRLACQGLCWQSCGPLLMAPVEMKRLVDAAGIDGATFDPEDLLCGSLDRRSHRCRSYGVRPLICRLYGAVQGFRCPYGCRPERLLSVAEAEDLRRAVEELSREFGYTGEGTAGVVFHDERAALIRVEEIVRNWKEGLP